MDSQDRARLAKAYLDDVCTRIDARQPLPRPGREWWRLAVPGSVAVGLSLAAFGCGGETKEEPVADVDSGADVATSDVAEAGEGSAPAENCTDGVDNDGDGQIDCADLDCKYGYPCSGPEYAAPF